MTNRTQIIGFSIGAALVTLLVILIASISHRHPQPATPSATTTHAVEPGLRIVEASRPAHQSVAFIRDTQGNSLQPPPSGPLAEALSPGSSLTFGERLKIIQQTRHKLEPQEVEALLTFLRQSPQLPGLTASQQSALGNDLLNLLQTQPAHEAHIRDFLRKLAEDSAQPLIQRDYALQHLASLEEKQGISERETHWQSIEQGPSALAATAMLHLLALERTNTLSTTDRSRLAEAALRHLEASTDPIDTATFLQVCARLQLEAARTPALEIATSNKRSFPLRIAAIATLGDLPPTEPVLNTLEAIQTGREIRLRLPAQSALLRLANR